MSPTLPPGWYFAALASGSGGVECVRIVDGDKAESVGYTTPLPLDRFYFFGPVLLPDVILRSVHTTFAERAQESISWFTR